MLQWIENHLFIALFTLVGLGVLLYTLNRSVVLQRVCPACGQDDLTRIHRTGLQRLFSSLKAYRCRNCAHQFVRIK